MTNPNLALVEDNYRRHSGGAAKAEDTLARLLDVLASPEAARKQLAELAQAQAAADAKIAEAAQAQAEHASNQVRWANELRDHRQLMERERAAHEAAMAKTRTAVEAEHKAASVARAEAEALLAKAQKIRQVVEGAFSQ